MPPHSAKRPQRSRRDLRMDTTEELSPSRPSKRRKKAQDKPSPAPPVDDESSLAADQPGLDGNESDHLVSRIVQHLLCPHEHPVQASKDHSNSIHETNQDGVKAYAKIAAQDWTFYVTKLEINIGRSSDPSTNLTDCLHAEQDDDSVHIDLGPSKTVSRQHAVIYFSSKDEQWFLQVKGRNGAKLDSTQLKHGDAIALKSGNVIEIGGVEMMFVLPSEISTLHINKIFLQRCGISPSDFPASSLSQDYELTSTAANEAPPPPVRGSAFQQPIAPAPPDYRRPGTPPASRAQVSFSHAKSPNQSAQTAAGGQVIGYQDIDLSLDDNRHIKPQYSYAQMITQAITNTPEEKLNLNGIYTFITTHYAYYRHQQAAGWQNSIRHNLSLNKAFDKVARSTDEPGKGMKWQLVLESRDEMIRNAYKGGRGGHRGSSAPSSPSQLNYITHGPKDIAAKDPPPSRKRKTSPAPSSPGPTMAAPRVTPERNNRRSRLGPNPASTMDGSPLPRIRSDATSPSLPGYRPQSPTLTSSFFQEDGPSFVTPAPPRVHPKLAPPSTAQRPSQHMPTSSPAPFWKYADIASSTPLRPSSHLLSSPSRVTNIVRQSSSSPPRLARSPVAGPDISQNPAPDEPSSGLEEEEQGFDLAKGFQSISSYHAPVSRGLSIANAQQT